MFYDFKTSSRCFNFVNIFRCLKLRNLQDNIINLNISRCFNFENIIRCLKLKHLEEMYDCESGRSRYTCVSFLSLWLRDAFAKEPPLWPSQYHFISNWSWNDPSMTIKFLITVLRCVSVPAVIRTLASRWERYSPEYSVSQVSVSKASLQNKPNPCIFEGPTYSSGKKTLIPFPRYLGCVLAYAPKPLTSTEDAVMIKIPMKIPDSMLGTWTDSYIVTVSSFTWLWQESITPGLVSQSGWMVGEWYMLDPKSA